MLTDHFCNSIETERIMVHRWQDADASDESFMLPQRLVILKALLRHDKISLAALNAPIDAMHSVTPLGLAAWLNSPEIVRMLLCECPGLVTVDGMDTSGATPLMCKRRPPTCNGVRRLNTVTLDAARDGRVEVVHDLVCPLSIFRFGRLLSCP